MIVYLSLLICLVGAALHIGQVGSIRVQTVGLNMFWVGLLVFLFKDLALIVARM